MSYAATALARTESGWTGDEIDLDEVEDLDGVLELITDVIGEDTDPTLLFVDEDDEWFGILRLGGNTEPRVFISDARMIESSTRAALLGEAAVDTDVAGDDDESPDSEDDDEDEGTRAEGDPAGDPALLSDLGTSAATLLKLCSSEGQLPSDIIATLCESAGCLDVLEKVRGESV